MKTTFKYLIKDFKLMMLRLLGVIFVVLLGVGFLIGLYTTVPNIEHTVNSNLNKYNTSDLQIVSTSSITNEIINQIVAVGNYNLEDNYQLQVTHYSEQLLMYSNIEILNENINAKIINTNLNSYINKVELVDGWMPSDNELYYEIVVEAPSSSFVSIPIDTIIEIPLLDRPLIVTGHVSDNIYFSKNKQLSLEDFTVFETVIYLDSNILDLEITNSIQILTNYHNRSFFNSKYRQQIDILSEQIKEIDSSLQIIKTYENENIFRLETDLNITKIISNIFPVFFFIIVLLVSISSISKIISRRRYEFGTLQSLGFNNSLIIIKMNFYVLLSTGIGILIGIALGLYIIPAVVHQAYSSMYDLPALAIKYQTLEISIITGITILILVLVTIFTLLYNLRDKPNDLLRGKAPKPGKKLLIERISFLWRRLPFKYKSSLRNIFRDKGQLILTFVGVIGSVALLLTGFGIQDSVSIAGERQFDHLINYELKVRINDDLDYEEIIDSSLYNYVEVSMQHGVLNNNEYIQTNIFNNIDDLKEAYNLEDLKGNPIDLELNGVYLSKPIATFLNIFEGDLIEITINNEIHELTVTRVFEMYFDNLLITTSSVINNSNNSINYLYFSNLDESSKNELEELVENHNGFIGIEEDEDLKETFNQMSKSLQFVVAILIFFSAVLILVINFTLTSINVNARVKEMGTLKVLGYSNFEVSGYMFRETLITSLITISLGLIVGKFLHLYIVSQTLTKSIILANSINTSSYLYTFGINLIVIGIVYFSFLPKLFKISMVESLKSYE